MMAKYLDEVPDNVCNEPVDWYSEADLTCDLEKGHEGEHYAIILAQRHDWSTNSGKAGAKIPKVES